MHTELPASPGKAAPASSTCHRLRRPSLGRAATDKCLMSNDECLMTDDSAAVPIRHSCFVIRHSLDIRHSSFDIPPRRGAFTLVELMVVIVIIIILMGLLTPVLINVMAKAREARISAEIAAMDVRFKAYKERFGSYPPSDFGSTTGQQLIALHLAHAFRAAMCRPKWRRSTPPAAAEQSPRPKRWCSGSADSRPIRSIRSAGTTRSRASTATRRRARRYRSARSSRSTPRGFGQRHRGAARQQPGAGVHAGRRLGLALRLFRRPGLRHAIGVYRLVGQPRRHGRVPPLLQRHRLQHQRAAFLYVNPNSYQIISAGLDGDFGEPTQTTPANQSPYFPSGNGLSQPDLDNLTNFSSGNLKDATPH